MLKSVAVNVRILDWPMNGAQRYTSEVLERIGNRMTRISPRTPLEGVRGHLWEQVVLPREARGTLLWSPSSTGPLLVRNQVVTIHDVVPFDHPKSLNPKFVAWYRFVLPRLAKRVARIITISEFSKGRIVDLLGVPAERVVVIPLGVGRRFCPRKENEVQALVKALALPSRRYVLALGSLVPRKNLERLLRAWQHLVNEVDDDVWLVVAGEAGKRSIFRGVAALAELPPRVYLTGRVADNLLPALYSGALMFVYLSEYEGFGLPPLEAMASGTPTLTGCRTSLPEVVGDAALTVDPLDLDAITDAMRKLLGDEDLRARLAAKGLARAASFTWDRAAWATWDVLNHTSS